MRERLLIDVGSTYFKIMALGEIRQYPRSFEKNIYRDLRDKCGDVIDQYAKEDIYICSSANGGLSTLIIGLTNSFSLRYATNIAYNSGINIIDTLLYPKIKSYPIPGEKVDVVIVVGGIDGVGGRFDKRLLGYLEHLHYDNIVYAGSDEDAAMLKREIPDITILGNILNDRLQVEEEELKTYLTNLYQADIIGKEEIKELYEITSNQIYSTPYVVNRAMGLLSERFPEVVDPFILIDIGGATTDIHYSSDLCMDNRVSEDGYDRLVFKKLGVYKSRESLIFSARRNEFVYELLNYLNVTENILEEQSEKATRILMQLAIFLVLYKVSHYHEGYLSLRLERLKSIVMTGGITKLLSDEEMEEIVLFFYRKILHYHTVPPLVIDREYAIWTLGLVPAHESE